MMKKLFVVSMILLLAGCADIIMIHPTKTSIDKDAYECKLQAEQRAANWGTQGNVFLMRDWMFECMEHRGWKTTTGK